MRRTQNEIYRLCQKAARGAGAPPGLEVEAAQATAWLSARGLPALHMLASDLSRVRGGQDCCFPNDSSNSWLDAGGKSGALVAPLLVDMILVSCIENAGPLQVSNLSSPLYLVPAAACYTCNGWCFDFSLRSVGGAMFNITVAPGSGVSIRTPTNSKLTALADEAFDVLGRCGSSSDSLAVEHDNTSILLIDENALIRAAENSLAKSVEVDAQTWNQLAQYAKKVLVAASEKSRSGAGAVTGDSE